MRISVVIPTFNNWRLTQQSLAALRRAAPAELLGTIVVVDDASTDGESPGWTTSQAGIVPLLLEQNGGFSRACNMGAARCSGDAILFLNNDAFMRAGSMRELHDVLAADETIGVVGARLLYSDGTLQHAGLTLLGGDVSRWWHMLKRQAGDLADAQIERDLPAVTGAALLIRRELFTRLGGFDEGFINGWEDVDLCLRAWCAGARVRYAPRAVIEHLESATLGRTASHAHNERRFTERWATILAAAPRYPLPEVPPIALAVSSAKRSDDAWAIEHIMRWWKAHLGAAVTQTRPGSTVDRLRVEFGAALARRQPTLEISWGDACRLHATGTRRIGYVAPTTTAEALAYAAARDVWAWWAPTDHARNVLCEAGIPAERVTVVRLGVETIRAAVPTGPPVVAAPVGESDFLKRLAREFPTICIRTLAQTRPALDGVDIVFAGHGGDRFGLLLPAALGQGCRVFTSPPVDSQVAVAAGATVGDEATTYDAIRADLVDIEALRRTRIDRYLDARRRLDAYLSTQHVAELARAQVGGIPSPDLVEVTPAFARYLRDLRTERGAVR